jgi:tetratricopeptide (TPR) repeat protein
VLYDGRSKLQFAEAVGVLFRFSLIWVQAREHLGKQLQEQLFEMHSLVQLAAIEWVKLRGQVHVWQSAALRVMATAFPSGQHETWAPCRTLLPHSTTVLSYSTEKNDETRLDRATIATNTAWYLMLVGQYAEAERIGRSAVAAGEEVLGREHPDTLTSVSQLGTVLLRKSEYEEAEAMHRRALEGYEKMLGLEHPYMLTSVSKLGSALWSQGRLADAEHLETRAVEARKRVLGDDHPNTLIAVHNLAVSLRSQGRKQEAMSLMEACAQMRARILALSHSDTESSTATLDRWRLESLDLGA